MPEDVVIDIDTFEIVEEGTLFQKKSHDKKIEDRRIRPLYFACILWEVIEDGVTHQLHIRTEEGNYGYWRIGPDWGHLTWLPPDDALWKTLEYAPELVSYV